MKIGKVIILTAIGIGAYLLLTKREAKAEEVSEIPAEIPSTPLAPENPAINMVDQILKELELAKEKIAKLEEEAKPSEICKQVKFIEILPIISLLLAAIVMIRREPRTAIETICGPNLKTIQEKAELRTQVIFSPSKATFQILD